MIAVIHNNRKEYAHWLEYYVLPENRSKFHSVRRSEDMAGLLFTEVIYLNLESTQCQELYAEAITRIRK